MAVSPPGELADLADLVAVVGATATGKSALGVALGQALGGEVLNADSMQLYAGMDIGTAKLPRSQRGGVAHHLLDVWPVTAQASVAAYQRLVGEALGQVRARGARPLLVGGSGLYVSAVVDRLAFPGTDPGLRAALEADLAADGPGALHARLTAADPAAAAAIPPTNGRRLVRALEVRELTGAAPPARLPGRGGGSGAPVVLGLQMDRATLDERIGARVDAMFQAGLLDEVATLVGRGLRGSRTASRALGYAQALAVLDGDMDETTARAATAAATRRFVRRQESWFRRDPRVVWLDATRTDLLDAALGAVTAHPGP